ncbi:Putative acyl-coenzyme A synthetase [Talaromyces islandicus]|uniref:Putative acyl-coenzyme A synthetase n=1 Tax=Talaromyces islandicus TaxID=28573 RepID=A0A0U1LTU4_TALIS|nr:Putative acyl-coenzyme A synthetase [Talaromyces islandicus]
MSIKTCGQHDAVDLLTFAFGGTMPYDPTQPLYIDAEDPSCCLNGDEFRSLVRSLIAGLKASGIQQGDCVLLHLPNSILYSALFFAIIGAGAVYMGSNPASPAYELDHVLTTAQPRLVITSADALSTVLEVSPKRGIFPDQIRLLDSNTIKCIVQRIRNCQPHSDQVNLSNTTAYRSVLHLLNHGKSNWNTFEESTVSKKTPAVMFLTSGTSGTPKAALLSHNSIIAQHLSAQYDVPYKPTRLMCLPMFHSFGAQWAHISPIRYGQPSYVLPRFEPVLFLEIVRRYNISETYVVPTMIHILNRSALATTNVAGFLTSMRYIGVAGASIDAPSMRQFRDMLDPQATVGQIWGMTETGIAFMNRFGEGQISGSIGKPTTMFDARIVTLDNAARVINHDNCPGELEVRGPGTLLGYKGGTQEKTKDENGWFKTGDTVYVKDGSYFIFGRTKELIKVYGWHVAPAEIEAVLLKHPSIRDAAVIGVPLKDSNTEAPRAFIVRCNTQRPLLTSEEVYTFAQKYLASYKALDGGVVFVNEIPRTASGKILRRKLADMNSHRQKLSSLLGKGIGKVPTASILEKNIPMAKAI